jgi:hypothetical protein
MGEAKGREGRLITRQQKGQAYSGFDVAHEREEENLLGDTLAKGEGCWIIRRRKSQERQILRKTWCRDDRHADRRHVYSILLTPSLFMCALVRVESLVLMFLISRRCRRCLNVSIVRQMEMIDCLISSPLLRMRLIDDELGPRHWAG